MRLNYRASISSFLLFVSLFYGWSIGNALAAEASSCTAIRNQATLDSGSFTITSNTTNTLVNGIIAETLTWHDSPAVDVIPGDNRQHTMFSLRNTGSVTETVFISINNLVSGDKFDPQAADIFLDSNYNDLYDPGGDLPPSEDGITLMAGHTVPFFIVADIPESRSDGTPLQDRDIGLVEIEITNNHGSGASGSVIPGVGDCGEAAIYRNAFPLHATARFKVKSIYIDIDKTSTIENQLGGNEPYPGATITYSLDVKATGSGTAVNLMLNDQIPDNTTYKQGTLTLDGEPLTDAEDEDTGEATGSPVNQINVRLGDQARGTRTVTFAVTID